MSLNSALVLISALLGLSCTQALPTLHQWSVIQENPVADHTLIDQMAELYSKESNFKADRMMPPEDDVPESTRHVEPPKRPDTGRFPKPQTLVGTEYHAGSRFVDRYSPFDRTIEPEFSSGNGFFPQDESFSRSIAVVHQPEYETEKRYIVRKSLLSAMGEIKRALEELTFVIMRFEHRGTPNTAETHSLSPVLTGPTITSTRETIKPSEEKEDTPNTATPTTRAKFVVLIDPNIPFEWYPTEPTYGSEDAVEIDASSDFIYR